VSREVVSGEWRLAAGGRRASNGVGGSRRLVATSPVEEIAARGRVMAVSNSEIRVSQA
jgi:hypothetical protein